MVHRVVAACLISLLLILHAQLWFGRGSVSAVDRLTKQLAAQNLQNQQAQLTNDRLTAEVRDLAEGLDTVEEKARMELGMVKPNEIFVQIASTPKQAPAAR